jgi:hypothetical protein
MSEKGGLIIHYIGDGKSILYDTDGMEKKKTP